MADAIRTFYPESRFGGFTDVDGTIAFYTRVNALLRRESLVLDVGCGRGRCAEDPVAVRRELCVLRGKCRRVIGMDVDPAGRSNPFVDEFRLIEGTHWPVDDASADLCVCDWVLEHVAEPDAFFAELRRVLRPGGHVCIRTPNVMSYVGLISKLIPNRWHAAVLARAQKGRESEDVFPTFHRCNTQAKIRRMLRRHGLDGCAYGYEAEPSYLSLSKALYALGVLHQRLAPRALRLSLFAFARRKA